jgi:hypothetical protein
MTVTTSHDAGSATGKKRDLYILFVAQIRADLAQLIQRLSLSNRDLLFLHCEFLHINEISHEFNFSKDDGHGQIEQANPIQVYT